MEGKNLLDDIDKDDIVETPKKTYKKAVITSVNVGTQAEIFDLDEGEKPRYGDRDDKRIQIYGETEHKGEVVTIYDSMNLPETLNDRHTLSKFIRRYDGTPEEEMEVYVYFNSEGNHEIVVNRDTYDTAVRRLEDDN